MENERHVEYWFMTSLKWQNDLVLFFFKEQKHYSQDMFLIVDTEGAEAFIV